MDSLAVNHNTGKCDYLGFPWYVHPELFDRSYYGDEMYNPIEIDWNN